MPDIEISREGVLKLLKKINPGKVSGPDMIPVRILKDLAEELAPILTKACAVNFKKGVQEFHRRFGLAPADKAANNVVVVSKRYYINTLKQELSTAKTYEHNRLDETSIVDRHRCHMAVKFGLFVD